MQYVLWRYGGSYEEYRHIDVSDQVSESYDEIVLANEDSLPCASGREIELVLEDSAGLKSQDDCHRLQRVRQRERRDSA